MLIATPSGLPSPELEAAELTETVGVAMLITTPSGRPSPELKAASGLSLLGVSARPAVTGGGNLFGKQGAFHGSFR